MSRMAGLAEGSSLAPNTLFSRALSDAWILGHCAIRRHLLQQQAGWCAACKAVFDPDLEQGGNINVVVRRDPKLISWSPLSPYAENP
jgi:hypothetical protein